MGPSEKLLLWLRIRPRAETRASSDRT
jgi:hypothetical protein